MPEERIKRKEENYSSPLKKTNYNVGLFIDTENLREEQIRTILSMFFPYHLFVGSNKLEKIAKHVAEDYACCVTTVSGSSTKEVINGIRKADSVIVIWDGESDDGAEALRLLYKDKIDTHIYYL